MSSDFAFPFCNPTHNFSLLGTSEHVPEKSILMKTLLDLIDEARSIVTKIKDLLYFVLEAFNEVVPIVQSASEMKKDITDNVAAPLLEYLFDTCFSCNCAAEKIINSVSRNEIIPFWWISLPSSLFILISTTYKQVNSQKKSFYLLSYVLKQFTSASVQSANENCLCFSCIY